MINLWQRTKLLFNHYNNLTHIDQIKGGYEQLQVLSRQMADEPKRLFVHVGETIVTLIQCAYHTVRLLVCPVTIVVTFTNHVRRDYLFQREIVHAVRRRDAFALPDVMWQILYTRYQICRLPFYYRLIKIITREIARERLQDVDRVYDDLVKQWEDINNVQMI